MFTMAATILARAWTRLPD